MRLLGEIGAAMIQKLLDRAKELCGAITQEPDAWRAYPCGMDREKMRGMGILGSHNHTPYIYKPNAEFISASRQLVPLLVRIVEVQREALKNISSERVVLISGEAMPDVPTYSAEAAISALTSCDALAAKWGKE